MVNYDEICNKMDSKGLGNKTMMPPRLLAWGANGEGQLGTGSTEDVRTPQPVLGDFDAAEIIHLVGGANHAFLLAKDGALYGSGDNRAGQLGIEGERHMRFVRVAEDVSMVACGWSHSILVDRSGDVWACGSNSRDQLAENYTAWTKIPISGAAPVRLVCGVFHSLLLASDGRLFGLGQNRHGQLGSHNAAQVFSWTPVAVGVKEVAAGLQHTLILHSDDTVELVGLQRHGQQPRDLCGTIRFIGSGWNHVVVVTCHDTVWSANCFGKNDLGQLGHPDASLRHHRFVLPVPVKGLYVGAEHCLVLLENGDVMTWGWNEHAACKDTPSGSCTPQVVAHSVDLAGATYAGCFAKEA